MLSASRSLLGVSPFSVFLRIVCHSGILLNRRSEELAGVPKHVLVRDVGAKVGRPAHNAANMRHLWKTLSKESRADITRWAEKLHYKEYEHSRRYMRKQRARMLLRLQQRARLLMAPQYVTSFSHFVNVNSDKFDFKNGSRRRNLQRFAEIGKLWRRPGVAARFREQQLRLMHQRRQMAKRELQRRISQTVERTEPETLNVQEVAAASSKFLGKEDLSKSPMLPSANTVAANFNNNRNISSNTVAPVLQHAPEAKSSKQQEVAAVVKSGKTEKETRGARSPRLPPPSSSSNSSSSRSGARETKTASNRPATPASKSSAKRA
jgi:hypothetical protein